MQAQQIKSEALKRQRAAFKQWMQAVDPRRVVVVDESGLVRGMRLAYGYSERGQRLYDTAPLSKGKRLNLVGWMRLDGSGAVATHVGTVNGPIFRGFVFHQLVPHLRHGDIVVWDNARIHEVEGLHGAIRRQGAAVKALPPYSPDFNPIELLWSKLKHWVRKARADTLDALQEAVESAVARVCESDAMGWYQQCGFCYQSN